MRRPPRTRAAAPERAVAFLLAAFVVFAFAALLLASAA
jgi:hypothetical protein